MLSIIQTMSGEGEVRMGRFEPRMGGGEPAAVPGAKKSKRKKSSLPESKSWVQEIGSDKSNMRKRAGKRAGFSFRGRSSGGDDGSVNPEDRLLHSIFAGGAFRTACKESHEQEAKREEARDAISSVDGGRRGAYFIFEAKSGTTSNGGTVLGREPDCLQDGTCSDRKQTGVDEVSRVRAKRWEEFRRMYQTVLCLVQYLPGRERALRKSSKWQELLIEIITDPEPVRQILQVVFESSVGTVDLVEATVDIGASFFWSLVYHFHPARNFCLGGTQDLGLTPSEQMMVSALPDKDWSHLKRRGYGRTRNLSEKAKSNLQQQPQPSPPMKSNRCQCNSCKRIGSLVNKTVSTMLDHAHNEKKTRFPDQPFYEQIVIALHMPRLVCSTLQSDEEAGCIGDDESDIEDEEEDDEKGEDDPSRTWIGKVIKDLNRVILLAETTLGKQGGSCKSNDLVLVKAASMMLIGVAISMSNSIAIRGVDGNNCADAINCFNYAMTIMSARQMESDLMSDLLAITSIYLWAREVMMAPVNDVVSFCNVMECGDCKKCKSCEHQTEKFLSLHSKASHMLHVVLLPSRKASRKGGDQTLNIVNAEKALRCLTQWLRSNQTLIEDY
jgi:hypothetical protein